ncbi:hypothetical protein GGI35DRAFT_484747 [Trichoderma velutinum]
MKTSGIVLAIAALVIGALAIPSNVRVADDEAWKEVYPGRRGAGDEAWKEVNLD